MLGHVRGCWRPLAWRCCICVWPSSWASQRDPYVLLRLLLLRCNEVGLLLRCSRWRACSRLQLCVQWSPCSSKLTRSSRRRRIRRIHGKQRCMLLLLLLLLLWRQHMLELTWLLPVRWRPLQRVLRLLPTKVWSE